MTRNSVEAIVVSLQKFIKELSETDNIKNDSIVFYSKYGKLLEITSGDIQYAECNENYIDICQSTIEHEVFLDYEDIKVIKLEYGAGQE